MSSILVSLFELELLLVSYLCHYFRVRLSVILVDRLCLANRAEGPRPGYTR